jgi:hypothetical protein
VLQCERGMHHCPAVAPLTLALPHQRLTITYTYAHGFERGSLGRKIGGETGTTVLWRGIQQLEPAVAMHVFLLPYLKNMARKMGACVSNCQPLEDWAKAANFSPPHWWGRARHHQFFPSPLVGEGRVGGNNSGSGRQTVDWPAVPGRPIPLFQGKELGCGTR